MDELALTSGNEVSVLVNGLGSTPLEEQYVVYRQVNRCLEEQGVTVIKAGISISVLKLYEELKRLLAKPVNTPFFKQEQLAF